MHTKSLDHSSQAYPKADSERAPERSQRFASPSPFRLKGTNTCCSFLNLATGWPSVSDVYLAERHRSGGCLSLRTLPFHGHGDSRGPEE
jgi:hypothetical protein